MTKNPIDEEEIREWKRREERADREYQASVKKERAEYLAWVRRMDAEGHDWSEEEINCSFCSEKIRKVFYYGEDFAEQAFRCGPGGDRGHLFRLWLAAPEPPWGIWIACCGCFADRFFESELEVLPTPRTSPLRLV